MSIFLLDSPAGYVSLEAVTKDSQDEDDDEMVSLSRISGGPRHGTEKMSRDHDRRVRREIANSNERRRMQNINAGFASLRSLLPIQETDKMSKAIVLHHATEYICQLEQEKEKLSNQLMMLKKVIGGSYDDTPDNKKMKLDGVEDLYDHSLISAMTTNELDATTSARPITGAAKRIIDDLRKRIVELRSQCEKERRLRLAVEQEKRALEAQLFDGQRLTIPITTEHGDPLELTYQVVDGLNGRETLEVSAEDEALDAPITISIPSPRVGDTDSATSIATKFLLNTDKISSSLLEAAILSEKMEVELTSMPTASCSTRLRDHMYAGSRPGNSHTAIKRKAPTLTSAVHRDRTQRSSVGYDVVDGSARNVDRSYLAEASRQNLETIVEAIRHLEGDHLFDSASSKGSIMQRGMYRLEPSDIGETTRVALSNEDENILDPEPHEDMLPPEPTDAFSLVAAAQEVVEEEPINLEFRPHSLNASRSRRPGVIVVKPF